MTLRPDLVALLVDEKMGLIEELWGSLTSVEKASVPMPDWHRDELHRRQVEIDGTKPVESRNSRG